MKGGGGAEQTPGEFGRVMTAFVAAVLVIFFGLVVAALAFGLIRFFFYMKSSD